jgi:hypothetical protein
VEHECIGGLDDEVQELFEWGRYEIKLIKKILKSFFVKKFY